MGGTVKLTPSQRITLIKEISSRLSVEEWNLIDVTLEQFGVPTTSSWNGTKIGYLVEMTKGAGDNALVDLAMHTGFQLEAVPKPSFEPPFWRKGYLRLFISHLSSQKDFASKLQEALLVYGISGFVAHSDIEPTAEWQIQIETALATADALVALLHPEFHKSNWTDQEIGFAMGRGLPTFSVRLGQDPYGFIGRFQAFSGATKNPKGLAEELFDAFRKNKQTRRRMSEIIVSLFENSESFVDSKTRVDWLEGITDWDSSYSKRIVSAAKSNSQIYNSWGVTDRVNALVRKWSKS